MTPPPPPPNPTETDPPGPGGDPDPKFGKKIATGIFGISAPREFRKIIICHVFEGGIIDHFRCPKNLLALELIMAD